MSLYAIYLLVFSTTCLVGVPMLSLVQITLIHRKSFDAWLQGLGTTMIVAVVLIIIIAIIMRVIMVPVMKIMTKAEKESITDEERYAFVPAFRKMKLVTVVALMLGFVIGNGSVVVIKFKSGALILGTTPQEVALTLVVVFVTCLLYAGIAIYYCTSLFEIFSQKKIRRLNITNIDGIKVSHFTQTVGFAASLVAVFAAWHVLCVGYGYARYPANVNTSDFFKQAFGALVWAMAAGVILPDLFLINLRKRFQFSTKKIQNLRDKGDLMTRIQIVSLDDFGELNSELNKLMAYLRDLVANVKQENSLVDENAHRLLEDAERSFSGIHKVLDSFKNIQVQNQERDELLSHTQNNIVKLAEEANEINNLVTNQASAVEQNSSSVTEMVANINSMTEMIEKAKDVSTELKEISENGRSEVTKTLNLIDGISEKSQRMSEITKVIQAVASQTNLLAMNAAIEAAHAGEAGQGFSVVADEIRSLAESTSKSTKEIKDLIDDMIEAVDKSTSSMQETSVVFNRINNGVQNQSQIVDTITNAMEEQTIGAKETLQVTNSISSQIAEISGLVKSQTEHNAQIKNDIANVVNLSEGVMLALDQSANVINDFQQTVTGIKDSANENRDSIQKVSVELEKFVI